MQWNQVPGSFSECRLLGPNNEILKDDQESQRYTTITFWFRQCHSSHEDNYSVYSYRLESTPMFPLNPGAWGNKTSGSSWNLDSLTGIVMMEYKSPISLANHYDVISSHINHPVKLLTSSHLTTLTETGRHGSTTIHPVLHSFRLQSFSETCINFGQGKWKVGHGSHVTMLSWNSLQVSGNKLSLYHLQNIWRLPPMSWLIKVTHTKRPDLIEAGHK